MLLLLGSLIAGMTTVVAPCVLPLLPIIIGGSVSGDTKSKSRPYIITASLAASLIVFTLLLKSTSLLINIPPQSITYVSGTVIIIIGLLSLFPTIYEKAIAKLGIQSKSQQLLGKGTQKKTSWGAIITGAALGPVFSSCSPVYAYVLATILPVNFAQAFLYILSYVLGLSIVLLLIGIFGQRFVSKIRFASNPKGTFQRIISILFIVVGLLVITGYDKQLQTWVSNNTPFDFDGLSAQLIPASSRTEQGGVLNVKPYKAPEFSNDLENWINSESLKLEELKGEVVLLDFWTYSCINCIRTQPYLRGWHDTYKDSGLTIVGMHAPEFAFERKPENVEKAVRQAGLEYPIALDNNFSTWNAYENQYWPSIYLIDKDGMVRRVHSGEGEYKETESAIRQLLQEDGGTVPAKTFIEGEAEVPVGKDQTPETYLGSRRATNYAGSPRLLRDKTQNFSAKDDLELNDWKLDGRWTAEGEKVISGSGTSSLTIKIAAKEVYLVAGSDSERSIEISLNGKAISMTKNAGDDVEDSKVMVSESKLYKLVKYGEFKSGDELTIKAPRGVELNVFTFGS